jgi:uncharacterized membrane protein
MLPFNPHPPLVMFAPTLGALCILFEVITLKYSKFVSKEIRFLILTLFLVACIASYYSGFYGADFATKLSPDVLKTHQDYARFGLIILLAVYFLGAISLLSSFSNRIVQTAYQVLLCLVCGIIIYTSHLGGELVFEHGGGVKGVGYEVLQ